MTYRPNNSAPATVEELRRFIDTELWRIAEGMTGWQTSHDDHHNPHGMVRWRGTWTDGEYRQYDMALDQGWLGIANKDTTSRPAPQPDGPASYAPDNATFAEDQYVGVVHSGAVYTLTRPMWIREVACQVVELLDTTNYRIVMIDITDPANPISFPAIEEPVLTALDWTVLAVGTTPMAAGTRLLVYVDALNSSPTQGWQHVWSYAGTSNNGAPPSGGWNRRTQQDTVRVHYTDSGGGLRDTELGTVNPGDILTFSNTANLNQYWEYQVNTSADQGDHYEFNVSLVQTGAMGGVPDGAETLLVAELKIADTTKFVRSINHWQGDTPSWATVEGYLAFDGVDQGATNDAFGIRLLGQPAIVSDDWDIAAHTDI